MIKMLTAAKAAKKELSLLTEAQKNNALLKMADALSKNTEKNIEKLIYNRIKT